MKILKSKTSTHADGSPQYLEKMEVIKGGRCIAILTKYEHFAMQFDSDLQIGYFLGVAGFKLDHFEIIRA